MGVGRWKADIDFDAGTVPEMGIFVIDFFIASGLV
jgi:hypothetical protein